MKKNSYLYLGIFVCLIFSLCLSVQGQPTSQPFNITIERIMRFGELMEGRIWVNGEIIGNTYENCDKRIESGIYRGLIRYCSDKLFVQNPFGTLAKEGDFLLEVKDSKQKRTGLLFHAGNRAEQSTGCILLGPFDRGLDGSAYLGENHPLRKLRILFYGTETPNVCPDKIIKIEIKEDK